MDDLWQQFHRLPRAIRDAVATPPALAAVERLEAKYRDLDLANFIMRVMVKEFSYDQLTTKLQSDGRLSAAAAADVERTLRQEVFPGVVEYLGLGAQPPSAPPRPTVPPPRKPMIPVARSLVVTPPSPPQTARPVAARPAPLPPVSPPPKPAPPARPAAPLAPEEAYGDEDVAEIAAQSAKVKELASTVGIRDLDDIARSALDTHRLAFNDELLTKRAVSILKARLKDIRSSEDTQMMLVRPPKLGGLGLDDDIARQLVKTIEAEAHALKGRGMVRPPEPPAPAPPAPVPTIEPPKPRPAPPIVKILPPANLPVAAEPLPSVTEPPRPAPPFRRPPDIPAPPAVTPPPQSTPAPAPPVKPVVQRPRTMERPAVSDIVSPAKTYGPAEEMRSMTLAEFRRLGQGANESAKKLLERFQHLKRESFSLWIEAIAGWRDSEVMAVYLEMGRQSLDLGTPIGQIIESRARQRLPYLSEHEFTVVADLNRQLQS